MISHLIFSLLLLVGDPEVEQCAYDRASEWFHSKTEPDTLEAAKKAMIRTTQICGGDIMDGWNRAADDMEKELKKEKEGVND